MNNRLFLISILICGVSLSSKAQDDSLLLEEVTIQAERVSEKKSYKRVSMYFIGTNKQTIFAQYFPMQEKFSYINCVIIPFKHSGDTEEFWQVSFLKADENNKPDSLLWEKKVSFPPKSKNNIRYVDIESPFLAPKEGFFVALQLVSEENSRVEYSQVRIGFLRKACKDHLATWALMVNFEGTKREWLKIEKDKFFLNKLCMNIGVVFSE